MTRAEIRNMARKKLGEVSGVFWSDDELNIWIDTACKDVAFKTKCVRTNGYMTPVASTADYTATDHFTGILHTLEVYYKISGTTWKKLAPIANKEDRDLKYPGWMNVTAGTPHSYLFDREENLLFLYPKPDSTNAGTNYLRAYYAKQYGGFTNDMSAPSGIPEEILHLAIVDWVVGTGYESRGYGDKSNDAMSKYDVKLAKYQIERNREKEDEEIQMRSYRS